MITDADNFYEEINSLADEIRHIKGEKNEQG
jgi:hypothetical protein